jgi:hypothetical protein
MKWFTVSRALRDSIVALPGYSRPGYGEDDDRVVMTGGEFVRFADDESRDVIVIGFHGEDPDEPEPVAIVETERGPIGPQRVRDEAGTIPCLVRTKSRGEGDPGEALEQIVEEVDAMLRADPRLGIQSFQIIAELAELVSPVLDVGDPGYTQVGMTITYRAYPR